MCTQESPTDKTKHLVWFAITQLACSGQSSVLGAAKFTKCWAYSKKQLTSRTAVLGEKKIARQDNRRR